ncbi:MAG: tRNA (guanosine(37)-N1)-methyltransferase TrmD [Deltaproteobacteria bacterium]|nr:tRNA (guanosine(37)-N1)-methyltransferase TrmD [Deltaproteobacteria bacterium]
MLHLIVLTLFPEIFTSFMACGLLQKAIEDKKIRLEFFNFRDFGIGKHKKVDDTPYGGGAGMVLRAEPIVECLEHIQRKYQDANLRKIILTPKGERFSQKKAVSLSRLEDPVILICGRYEGFDERIYEYVDEQISLGDFVMQGGEVAVMALIESISRLKAGVIGNKESLDQESFQDSLLEYAQYTRPDDFRGSKVPEVLLKGNHQQIKKWREESSLSRTKLIRPDLIEKPEKE